MERVYQLPTLSLIENISFNNIKRIEILMKINTISICYSNLRHFQLGVVNGTPTLMGFPGTEGPGVLP